MVQQAEAAGPAPAPSAVLRWRRALVLAGGLAATCHAAEIAPFRLTGVDGYAAMRYFDDQVATRGGAEPRSRHSQSAWRNELFLMTHSYVYHPNLLTLDIGGGPILEVGEAAADGNATRARSGLYNFLGRATFLRGKPVSGALFYEHLNPSVSLTPGQIMNLESSRYGFELSAAGAAVPLPLRLEATRSESHGRSAERIADDRTDQVSLRLSHSLGGAGATQVQVQAARQESLSGSPNLPIQSSQIDTQSLSADTRFEFGADGRYELSNQVTVNRNSQRVAGEALPEQSDLRLILDLRIKHSPQHSSYAIYHRGRNDNGERVTLQRSLSAGTHYALSRDFDTSFGARTDDSEGDQISQTNRGLDGSLRYQQETPFGRLQGSYNLRYDQRSQTARATRAEVVGERVTLNGSTVNTIASAHVVAGSVVVSNLTRSQRYVENLDYVLSSVGTRTRLQRLAGGNIVDGEEVLVDYAFDTGGSYAYHQIDQTVNLSWAPSSLASVYFREYHSSPRLDSGAPTFPLNAVASRLYGVRADVPFQLGVAMSAGGSAERENTVETIAPQRRTSGDLYLQTEEPLFGVGNLGLSLRRMSVDYANAAQNLDLVGYGLRFSTRSWFGIDVSAVRNFERDASGPLPRQRWSDAINAQWRERKLTVTARLGRTRETQGDFARTHTIFQFVLRREL